MRAEKRSHTVEQALIDLYLNVKVPAAEDIENYSEDKLEEERETPPKHRSLNNSRLHKDIDRNIAEPEGGGAEASRTSSRPLRSRIASRPRTTSR